MTHTVLEKGYLYSLEEELLKHYDSVMKLKIFVDSTDEDLKIKYSESIHNHNEKLKNNIEHIDAGFDLFAPDKHEFVCTSVNKLDYKIVCSATITKCVNECRKENNSCFYMYPRSSISKSNLRLANSVGIIDAGYRGHLMGMFDCIYVDKYIVNKFDRQLQICAPGLMPIIVTMVHSKEELGLKTLRGEGGFGSTGM